MDGTGNGEFEVVATGDECEIIYLPYSIRHFIAGVPESESAA
jgi:hypothetical protein